MAALADVISNKQSFFWSDQHAVIPNKLAFPSLLDLHLYFEDSDLINLRTNTIQSNWCATTNQTKSVTHENKA